MPKYADPGGLIVMGAIFPILGFIATVLRFYTRRLQKAKLLIDDWLLIPAEIVLIGIGVALIIGVVGHGEGYALPTEVNGVPTDGNTGGLAVQTLAEKVEFAILTVANVQLGLTKLSILFFYRRIFCTSKTSFLNLATITMITIVTLWTIAFFFVNLLECGTKLSINWKATQLQANELCIDEEKMNEGNIFSDFILDVIILLMPLPTIWNLNMPLKRRIAVIVILILGALTVVASVIKVVIIVGIVFELNTNLLATDPDILVSTIIFWTVLECGLSMIIVSLPTLRGLMDRSPDLLRSLRSMVSLQSMTSNTSRSKTHNRSSDEQSTSSRVQIAKISAIEAGMGNETFAMKDLPGHSDMEPGITVLSQVRQDTRER